MNIVDARYALRVPKVLQVLQDSFRGSTFSLWDGMPVAICICDGDGAVVRFNRRAAEMWGEVTDLTSDVPRHGVAYRMFHADGRVLRHDELPMIEVLRSGRPQRERTLVLERSDGNQITVLANVDPVLDDDGVPVGTVNCFQDLSEHKRMEDALRERDQRLSATYDHVDVGIAEADETGKIVRVNETMCRIAGFSREEMLGYTLYCRTHPDDVARDRLNYRQQVTGGYDRYAIEKRFIKKDGTVIWISVLSSSVCDEAGNFKYGLRVVQDVTERRLADERQRALIEELNHRVKNIIATVQSLAAHTLREDDVAAPVRRNFDARLMALARVNERLMGSDWQSADLGAMIGDIVAPYRDRDGDIRCDGRAFRVQPRAAVTLALVLHELATNAVKYGAMSVPGGSLDIYWRIQGAGDEAMLILDWTESKGPTVTPPTRRGFGSRLLELGIARQLNGSVETSFEPVGFRSRLNIPMASIAAP